MGSFPHTLPLENNIFRSGLPFIYMSLVDRDRNNKSCERKRRQTHNGMDNAEEEVSAFDFLCISQQMPDSQLYMNN